MHCDFCHLDFNFIGKTETFTQDIEFIVKQTGLDNILPKFLIQSKVNSVKQQEENSRMEKYIKMINQTQFKAIWNTYRIDFEMFNYTLTNEIQKLK